MFGKNLGKFRVNLNLVLSTFFLRFSFSLDAKVLEIDFLQKFAKFAEPSNGLANAKQFARYLHLPVDHLKAMEIFGIYDSVCTVLYTMGTPLFFFVFISLPTFVSRQCYGDPLHQFRISISISYFLISGSIWYDQL